MVNCIITVLHLCLLKSAEIQTLRLKPEPNSGIRNPDFGKYINFFFLEETQ